MYLIQTITSIARSPLRLHSVKCKVSFVSTLCKKNMSSHLDGSMDLVKRLINAKDIPGKISDTAVSLMRHYDLLTSQTKQEFLVNLAVSYQRTTAEILKDVSVILSSEQQYSYKVQQKLKESLSQPNELIFKLIGSVEGGVKFLVDLRKDMIRFQHGITNPEDLAALQAMNRNLKELLSLWFGVGFLKLKKITWQAPCDLLEKIANYEVVHPFRNVADLRSRVGPYRRCFIFTHPSMPREPIVILHVGLVTGIASNIDTIVKQKILSQPMDLTVSPVEDASKFDTAIFYSITSTQAGLHGIDLGNYLIKRVAKELVLENPNLKQFSTLSPIPGFKNWVVTEINQVMSGSRKELLTPPQLERLSMHFNCENDTTTVLSHLKSTIQVNDWYKNPAVEALLKDLLMSLCVRYLYCEKHRGDALDAVANFHLKNGATLWRLNWLANKSIKGMNESCGIMVNYRYFLEKTDINSELYNKDKKIDISEQVLALLSSNGLLGKM